MKTLDNNLIPSKDNNFIHYRSFLNLEEARKIETLLEQKQIPHLLDIPRESIPSSIVGEGMVVKGTLNILAHDFNRVDAILREEIKKIPFAELKDHPLHTYSEEDLYDILIHPDEWNIENITMAELILSARGKEVSKEEIDELRRTRIDEIREGKSGSKPFILLVVVLVLLDFFNAQFTFSVLGVATGAYYRWSKNYDLNGDAYFEYDKETRSIGTILFSASILFFLVKVSLVYIF